MMKWTLTWMFAIGFSAARADDPAEILAKAVKASAGSDESLAKRKFTTMKQTGVVYLPTGAAVASRETLFALPERAKWIDEIKPTTGPLSVTAVLSGLRGWLKTGGMIADLAPSQYEALQNEAYTFWLASLAPYKSRSIQWELMKDGTVDGRPTRMLKANQPGRPVVILQFDRDSHLLLKAAYAGTENLKPAAKEYVFSGHKEFEGQRLPGKVQVFQSGRKIEEWTNDSVRFPSSIDERSFAKPQ